jgi:hypothetical protein
MHAATLTGKALAVHACGDVARHQLAVVVVNHVVDCVEESAAPSALVALEQVRVRLAACAARQCTDATLQATGGRALRTSGRRVMPALGLHWAHCVSTRLFLSRASPAGALGVDTVVSRRMRVVFAPHLPPAECAFTVAAEGVRGCEGAEEPESPPS